MAGNHLKGTKIFTVRMKADELRQCQAAAKLAHLSLNGFLVKAGTMAATQFLQSNPEQGAKLMREVEQEKRTEQIAMRSLIDAGIVGGSEDVLAALLADD